MLFGGVTDFETREQAELDCLLADGIGAGDDGLARNHGRNRRQGHHRQQGPIGIEQEEWVFERFRIGQYQRALPEIVHRERRQDQSDPGGLDRLTTEMAQVGVQCFGAGNGEKYGAERDEADHAVSRQETHPVARIESQENFGLADNRNDAGNCDGDEPQRGDGTEEGSHFGGSGGLHGKQRHQNHHRERHDVWIEGGRCDLEAFDRGEHRQRRRDHRIAIEQRGADDAAEHHGARALAERALGQCHQRERAAFAAVVRSQQDEHVFQRDHDDQGPQDERQHAQHRLARQVAVPADGGGHRFAQGIERAGSDVPVDDADAAEGQRPKSAPRLRPTIPVGRDCVLAGSGERGAGHCVAEGCCTAI